MKEKVGSTVPLLASSEFMNRSGSFVGREARQKGVKAQQILILHDDSDLPLGTAKLDFNRGAGGHNGVADIIATLQTQEFYRLRIGVRKKTWFWSRRKKAGEFVLKQMPKKDEEMLRDSIESNIEKITRLLSQSNSPQTNTFHQDSL